MKAQGQNGLPLAKQEGGCMTHSMIDQTTEGVLFLAWRQEGRKGVGRCKTRRSNVKRRDRCIIRLSLSMRKERNFPLKRLRLRGKGHFYQWWKAISLTTVRHKSALDVQAVLWWYPATFLIFLTRKGIWKSASSASTPVVLLHHVRSVLAFGYQLHAPCLACACFECESVCIC